MPRPTCRICEAPGDARTIVDALLSQKIFLREIAKQTGFSKSSVHRHSRNCYIAGAAKSLQSVRFDPARDRVFVRWPGQPFDEAKLAKNDWIVNVVYEKLEVENPSAPVDEALAEDRARTAAKAELLADPILPENPPN